jgi:hypothetical protein
LENVAFGATVLSTHQSLEGVPFGQFLDGYLKNLQIGPVQKDERLVVDVSKTSQRFQAMWNNLRMPYVACAGDDAHCSEAFQSIPGVFTGVLAMTPKRGADRWTALFLVGQRPD